MKRAFTNLFIPLFLLCFVISLNAQDTIVVQTINLEDDFREGNYDFPNDETQTYRKILMKYQMRCHDGLVGAGAVGCGEWDYHCNTVITDSTKVDSLKASHPDYVISNFNGDIFEYSNAPTYHAIEFFQYQSALNGTPNIVALNNGSEDLNAPFGTSAPRSKVYYLLTSSELQNAGLNNGQIHGMSMDVTEVAADISFLKIKLRHVAQSTLTPENIILDGFTEVYFNNTTIENTGDKEFNFYNSFDWDGTSNVLMEISYQNNEAGIDNNVAGANVQNKAIISNTTDAYLGFNGAGEITVAADVLSSISTEFTFSAWVYGSEGLPANTSLFEGKDGSGNRQVNAHVPWSNSRVYWDCGNDGSGYDRIDKAAEVFELEGRWNHWAFTKNTDNGTMYIYLNGQLWHSGTAKLKTIDNLAELVIGRGSNNSNPFLGNVDEIQIWSEELDEATIQQWMHRSVNNLHPNYPSLLAYYKLDEGAGDIAVDSSPLALNGTIGSGPSWKSLRANEYFKNFVALDNLPNFKFMQGGDVTVVNTEVVIYDSIQADPHNVDAYIVENNDLILDNSTLLWPAGDLDIYDENGLVVGSNYYAPDGDIAINSLNYYRKTPARFEILSFITPYGNYLNLGDEGKVWTFDVTDFAPILKGNKRLSIEGVGKNSEEYDISFEFITGTPPLDVISIQQLWPIRTAGAIWSGFGMASIMANDVFEPREVTLNPNASRYKFRSSITGHGSNGEFVSREHYMNINGGTNEFEYDGWKECAENPIYPQGGTWIFDRAGWCPAMETDVHHLDFTSMVNPGESITVDYGINGQTMSDADYRVSNQLVSYGSPNFIVDAELLDIKRPSNKVEHARYNPVCNDPIVVLKNSGAFNVGSVRFKYRIIGSGQTLYYDWTGNLGFLETTEVILPVDDHLFWQSLSSNLEFEASIVEVNGAADENVDNNLLKTVLNFPEYGVFTDEITLRVQTNNRANENTYRLLNQQGEVIFSREDLSNATVYEDDIELNEGCYTIEMTDLGDDGLDFWFNNASTGVGSFRLKRNGANIKTFEPDFGDNIRYDFFVGQTVDNQELPGIKSLVSVYPNPANAAIHVELQGFDQKTLTIELIDLTGRVLIQEKRSNIGATKEILRLDTESIPNGMYYVSINDGTEVKLRSIIKQGNQ